MERQPFKLFNSDGRKMMDFVPIKENEVGIYCCGPTVYNYAHIGNLRTYLFEDILHRILQSRGYNVHHVMNITDVGHLTDDGDAGEDKMIKSAREKGMSVWDIAKHFTQAFFEDTKRLNIIKPAICCNATDHIQTMIELIRKLEQKGFAYQSGGNLYFDTVAFKDYGKMALLDRQKLLSGSRVEIDSNKRHPADFVLWFTESKFENQVMVWDSPWGKGYPGWHIECSAMSMNYLGEQFDIHCGGIDHIPVHHTNEIAQSEAATGKKWVNYWIHGEFLVLDKGKMSKSGGSFITLQTLIDKGYDPLDYRYFCLGAHYRTQLQFSYEALDSAKIARKSLNKKVGQLKKACSSTASELKDENLKTLLAQFYQDCDEDMSMPKALSRLYAVLKTEAEPAQKWFVLCKMDEIFGLRLDQVASDEEKENPLQLEGEAALLFEKRVEARKSKDWAESDRLREALLQLGIEVKDTPQGTIWNYK